MCDSFVTTKTKKKRRVLSFFSVIYQFFFNLILYFVPYSPPNGSPDGDGLVSLFEKMLFRC